jgi:hypothetical protein
MLWPAVGGALVLAVAACGGGGASAATPAASATTQPADGQAAGNGPAASGLIAAVTATNAQVQNPTTGQVTVGWTASTTFSKTATVAASAVAVGDCVTAVGGAAGGTPTAFTATTVTLSTPVNGRCAGGAAGGFRGTRPGATGGGATPRPNRTMPAGAGRLGTAFGTVTSVSGSTFVVADQARARGANATASPAPTTTTSPAPTTMTTVTIGPNTTVQQTSAATASAVVVGQCLTALGKADDTGAVTATAISITPEGKQGCTTGFGAGRFGGGQRGAQNGSGGTNA